MRAPAWSAARRRGSPKKGASRRSISSSSRIEGTKSPAKCVGFGQRTSGSSVLKKVLEEYCPQPQGSAPRNVPDQCHITYTVVKIMKFRKVLFRLLDCLCEHERSSDFKLLSKKNPHFCLNISCSIRSVIIEVFL